MPLAEQVQVPRKVRVSPMLAEDPPQDRVRVWRFEIEHTAGLHVLEGPVEYRWRVEHMLDDVGTGYSVEPQGGVTELDCARERAGIFLCELPPGRVGEGKIVRVHVDLHSAR